MNKLSSTKRQALICSCAIFFVLCVGATRAAAQAVYMVCTWDTSSVYKQKDGKEKFERRFYVTNLIETTKEVYVEVKKVVPRVEEACGDYLQRTVAKAAEERGERLESGTLKVLKNIDTTDDGMSYKFGPRGEVEKQRADIIKEYQDAGRQILPFNWDLTYDSEEADLAKERQRIPANLAAPPATQAPRTAPQSTQTAAASQSAPATNYIFGWARVLTTALDLDNKVNNEFSRAYYSNIVALPTNANAAALEGQVSALFNQLGVAEAMKVKERLQIKGVTVKTFKTLVEADNARYAMATQDREQLNANAGREVALPVSYFTWNYYGSRRDLFPEISEFVTTGYDPQWEFVVFEVRAQKQVGGQEVNEMRYYVSYPYELFMTGRESINRKKHINSYFTRTAVEPAALRGLKLDYYDNEIEFFPGSLSYKTFAEAWAARVEKVDVIKGNEYPQYDFLVISNGPNKGEGTSFPFCASGCTGERARITSLEMKPATKKP